MSNMSMDIEKYKEKLAFRKNCREHGFRKEDYDLVFDFYVNDRHRVEVRLAGFTGGGRCILVETGEGGRSFRQLPHDVMIAIRDYHRDMMDACTDRKEYEKARAFRRIVADDTKRLKDAGFEMKAYELFNPYGDPMNGHLVLEGLSRELARGTWHNFVF